MTLNDGAGCPVVVMMGSVQDARNTSLVVRRWAGAEWTDPVELDHFDGSGHFGRMVGLLDSHGRMHVAYDRRLDKPEAYGVMDGQFPDKCFHALYDGQRWSRGKATTGAGRYYIDPVGMGELPDGTVCLLAEISAFGILGGLEGRYLGNQRWDGKAWSAVGREPVPEAVVSIGANASFYEDPEPLIAPDDRRFSTMHDYWGNTIAWVGDQLCLVRRHQAPDGYEAVSVLSTGYTSCMPLLKRDRSGRIALCSCDASHVEVRLWNGNGWAEPLTFPSAGIFGVTKVLFNPDGNMYVIGKGKDRFVIRRIRMLPLE
ncbi:MAG: hypothetical protein ISS74_07710 [Planctomycetes bacterium]|nr:hypothetical protein [Planctomycetota bacterium]